jgi:hypothetical protein
MASPVTTQVEQDAEYLAKLLRHKEYAALSQVESNALGEYMREAHKWDANRIAAAFTYYRTCPAVVRNIMGLGCRECGA